MKQLETDVVVVAAGLSGLAAAVLQPRQAPASLP